MFCWKVEKPPFCFSGRFAAIFSACFIVFLYMKCPYYDASCKLCTGQKAFMYLKAWLYWWLLKISIFYFSTLTLTAAILNICHEKKRNSRHVKQRTVKWMVFVDDYLSASDFRIHIWRYSNATDDVSEPAESGGRAGKVVVPAAGRSTATTTQPVRASTRILKRPKRDFSPPASPPKKSSKLLWLKLKV